jgi:hypothetical protein
MFMSKAVTYQNGVPFRCLLDLPANIRLTMKGLQPSGANHREEHLKGGSGRYASTLLTNIKLGWKRLPGQTLYPIWTISKLSRKKFYNIGPWTQ